MRISENSEHPYHSKEVAIQCTACGKRAVVLFPYAPTPQQRIFAIKEVADEHRKWCKALAVEEERSYSIWYPRK